MVDSSTVGDYIQTTRNAGLNWPLPEDLTDTTQQRLLPDFHEAYKKLQFRQDVTLNLLWQENKERGNPDGCQYNRYCHNYRDWAAGLDVAMRERNSHRAKPVHVIVGLRVIVVCPDSTADSTDWRYVPWF